LEEQLEEECGNEEIEVHYFNNSIKCNSYLTKTSILNAYKWN
jgi:hypothetical protein